MPTHTHTIEEIAGRKWIVRQKPPHLRARYNFGQADFDLVECNESEEKKAKLLTKARLFARSVFTYGKKFNTWQAP